MQSAPFVFFSNRVERLYVHLKQALFHSGDPFAKRIIIVPSPAMKSWLLLQMAHDSDLKIASGIEVGYVDQSIAKLFDFLSPEASQKIVPPPLELAFVLEAEIRRILSMPSRDAQIWQPLLDYLQFKPDEGILRKTEKRLIALAEKLAHLFIDYGKYGGGMLKEWQTGQSVHWQQQLWVYLESKFFPWNYPYRQLDSFNFHTKKSGETQVHLFALSYLSPLHHRFLMKVAQQIPVNYYLLSPCQEFWSDILSTKESQRLKNYWKKRGVSSSQQLALDEYLRDNNPLLANFGRLGREMVTQVETSDLQTSEDYILPADIKEQIPYRELLTDHMHFQERSQPFSLLEAVQSDLVLLRNPDSSPKVSFAVYDASIQVHQVSRPMQEIQVLYDTLLKAIEKHSQEGHPLYPSEIIVMAPHIMDYEPYINSVFGSRESVLDFQIMDVQMPAQSLLVKGFLHLLEISMSRWDATSLLRLFDFRYFQMRHQINSEDLIQIQYWIKEAGIKWGKNRDHRNELLKQDYCLDEMIEEGDVGTWEYGIGRLVAALGMLSDQNLHSHLASPFPPLELLETAQSELLGKLIRLLQSLLADLKPLHENVWLTLKEWATYLKCLLDAYFAVPSYQDEEREYYQVLIHQIEAFGRTHKVVEEKFSFLSIQKHLYSFLTKETINYRGNQFHAVKFCSLLPMRSIPAKVVALLGMQDGSFPRKEDNLSLNLMLNNPLADYNPSALEFDRYLFLEALLSARQSLIITYSAQDKEQLPSLLVTELLGYLDQAYLIQDQKASQICLHKHPFLSFDRSYFEGGRFRSYSKTLYRAAVAYYCQEKEPAHQFVPQFYIASPPKEKIKEILLNLKDLISFAKDPVKAYFNKTLGIYLEKEETRIIKNEEEFQISPLDHAILSRKALSMPLNIVLSHAAKEGRLPLGPFKQINVNKIENEVEKLKALFAHLMIDWKQFFEIEFTSCQTPFQNETGGWKVPALMIPLENGTLVKVEGKIADVTPQGIVGYIKEDPSDVAKLWPVLLIFSCLLRSHAFPIENQLIFAKNGKLKSLDFANPERLLARYLDYYVIGMNCMSPLIPDWIPAIISLNDDEFKKVLSNQWENVHNPLYNDYIRWLSQGTIPHSQSIMKNWQKMARGLFTDLYFQWFPKLKGRDDDTL